MFVIDLMNASSNPFQTQYYQFGPDGVQNISAAVGFGATVSLPHFLDCDDRLVADIKGLNPTEAAHQTFLDIEPQ